MIDGGCALRSERWHTHGHLIHQGRRIIFLFKHCTIFIMIVDAEPGGRGGGLLEVTFTCTRMLENMEAFSTSQGNIFIEFWCICCRGTRAGNAATETKSVSILWRLTCSMSNFFSENTDKSDFFRRWRRAEVRGWATILRDTPRATKLQSVYLGNTNVRLGLLATSATDKYSWGRRLRLPGIRVFVNSRLARKYI